MSTIKTALLLGLLTGMLVAFGAYFGGLTAPFGDTDRPIWLIWSQDAVVLLPRD